MASEAAPILGSHLSDIGSDIRSGKVDDSFLRSVTDIRRAAEQPKGFMDSFDESVLKEKNRILKLVYEGIKAETISHEDCRIAFDRLRDWAIQDKKLRPKIDLTDDKEAIFFGSALVGMQNFANESFAKRTESDTLFADQMMQGTRKRELQLQEVVLPEIGEKLGIIEKGVESPDFNKEYLLNLIGTIVSVDKHQLGSLKFLMGHKYGKWVTDKQTDEIDILLDAFGGKDSPGVFEALTELSDLTKTGVEGYAAAMKSLSPNEMFYLAHMPFTVKSKSQEKDITIKIAEVVDFINTPDGKKQFRMKPDTKSHGGLSEYIKWLEKKYPGQVSGMTEEDLSSVVSLKQAVAGADRWEPIHGLLDEGHTKIGSTKEPYISMATTTWKTIYDIARGMAHVMIPKRELYPGGAVFHMGTEIQKAANAVAEYRNSYALDDAVSRVLFPRFGTLRERMVTAGNPYKWFESSKNNPDLVDPFNPRTVKENGKDVISPDVSGGIKINWEKNITNGEKAQMELFLTSLFFAPEEDPGELFMEQAVAELYAGENGGYYDGVGVWIEDDSVKLNNEELIELAWKWEAKIRNSLASQAIASDVDLKTVMNYRTFFPLDPKIVMSKLENIDKMPEKFQKFMKTINWEGLIKRFGGDTSRVITGVEGAREVVKAMGSGLWSQSNWGATSKDAAQKQGIYETYMMDVNKAVTSLWIDGTQSLDDEIEKKAGKDFVHGTVDAKELFMDQAHGFLASIKGFQPDSEERVKSLGKYLELYTETIKTLGFMTSKRGIWWFTRHAGVVADYMMGKEMSYKYLHVDRSYIETKGKTESQRKKLYMPVILGDVMASYSGKYAGEKNKDKRAPKEALAVLGCNLDGDEPNYKARAAGIPPIGLRKTKEGFVADKVALASWFGSERQLMENKNHAAKLLKKRLWKIINDQRVDGKHSGKRFFPKAYDKSWMV